MKRRFLALALALVMVVSLLPVLPILTVSAETTTLDLSQASTSTKTENNYYVPVGDYKFNVVDGVAKLDAVLDSGANYISLNYKDVFTSAENVDEHVTQTILIEDMPIFGAVQSDHVRATTGYYNLLVRNYATPTSTKFPSGKTAANCHDSIMYGIHRKDEAGNLGLYIIYAGYDENGEKAHVVYNVEKFAETMNTAFELTTVWHANDKVSFFCDGEFLGTFDNVTYAEARTAELRESLTIGYNAKNAPNGEGVVNTVKLSVSNVKIAHGHTAAADDGNCTTSINCTDCGGVMTPAKAAHIFDRKVPAETFKKADGEYYLSCECGTSSAATEREATFTLFDLYADNQKGYIAAKNSYYTAHSYTPEGAEEAVEIKFDILESNKYSALLTAGEVPVSGHANIGYRYVFGNGNNVDEHLTQTIQINSMPYIGNAKNQGNFIAYGYYNLLSRNYQTATGTLPDGKTAADCMDLLLYCIYDKDNKGNLGMRICNPGGVGNTPIEVPLNMTTETEFVLTTVWHANDTVSFYCNGEHIYTSTEDTPVIYTISRNAQYRDGLVMGYFAYNSNDQEDTDVNLTVSNVQINHGCVAAADDGDCTTAIKCITCGKVMTEAQTHNPAEDDDDCTTGIECTNEGCDQIVTPGAAAHTPVDVEVPNCTVAVPCAVCGKTAVPATAHTPAEDDHDCTTALKCTVCKAVIESAKSGHIYDHKVVADDYKKADREYYLSCACGTSSEGTESEATFTLFDLSLAMGSTDKTQPNYYTICGTQFSVTTDGVAAKVEGNLTTGSGRASINYEDIFTETGKDYHLSQTLYIETLAQTSNKTSSAKVARGYYNLLTRNFQGVTVTNENDGSEYLLYSITCINANGDLQLNVFNSVAADTTAAYTASLGKKLGDDPFTLTTVWHKEGHASFYCDGEKLSFVDASNQPVDALTSVTANFGADGAGYYNSLSFGVNYNGAPKTVDTDGNGANDAAPVELTVSNVQISQGHTIAADDGSCLTADYCTDCGALINEAKDAHVQAEDDGNCVTPVLCSNPGCAHVFVEGHTLEHRDEIPATDDATGTKEHWYCAVDGFFYLDAEGTQKVSEGDLVIDNNIDVSGDKSTVSPEFVQDKIEGAGEGDVALEVETPAIELPAAALNALVQTGKPLVITTSEGVVTLDAAALASIQGQTQANVSVNVKKAGTSVLAEAQTSALSSYAAIKDVISAEMFAGAAITSFGEGKIAIEIPFVLDEGTEADKYMLFYVSEDGATVEHITNAVFANGKLTATLSHFSDYAIVYNGELPQEPVEGNTTIITNGGSSFATVTGTYIDGIAAGDVFSVDVEWGNLAFNYMAANSWDPETHTNTGGGWEEATGNVKVTNHSNIKINVNVTKVDVGGEKNLGVNFLGASTDTLEAGTPDNVGELADSFTVEFKPQGTLVEGDTDVTLATITVTITKFVETQE